MKLTPNQTAVLETLSKSDKPLSAYEILNFENIRDSGIKAPLTVYRALDKLIDKVIKIGDRLDRKPLHHRLQEGIFQIFNRPSV